MFLSQITMTDPTQLSKCCGAPIIHNQSGGGSASVWTEHHEIRCRKCGKHCDIQKPTTQTAQREAYHPKVFAQIVVNNFENKRKVMAKAEDWYALAKAYLESLAIMEQNNCVAMSSNGHPKSCACFICTH